MAIGALAVAFVLAVVSPATAASSAAGGSSATPSVIVSPGATPSVTGGSSANTLHTSSKVSGKSAQAGCAVSAYGYVGYEVCGYAHEGIDHGGGNIEWFVVGTNYAIFHIWLGSGGWKSLGGQSSRDIVNGAYTYWEGVMTVGTDNNWWCRDWPWSSGWYRC